MNENITPGMKSNLTLPVIVGAVIIVAIAVALFFYLRAGGPSVSEPPAAEAIENIDLGSEVYDKSTNPVKGQLPGTVAPVTNPLEGAYQNPFK